MLNTIKYKAILNRVAFIFVYLDEYGFLYRKLRFQL